MATAEILFVASDRREFSGALRFWQQIRPVNLPVHWARSAIRKGRPVLAVANGVGWQRACLAARAAPFAQLCNIGFCGALDPGLCIGDIVTSSRHLPVRCEKNHLSGPIFSSPRMVQTSQAKQRLSGEGYIAVEMEADGLKEHPFYCIKAVSDLADETFANDFEAALLPDGRISPFRLLAGALRRPATRIPELLLLARRSSAASEKLGEFLDACEF